MQTNSKPRSSGSEIPDELKQDALAKVVNCELFSQSERLKEFLTYVVNEAIAGRGDEIRGKTIAQDVYLKNVGAEGDPDNVVRVDARRLRQTLAHYYETDGVADPVRLHIDSGGYEPRFENIDIPVANAVNAKQPKVGLSVFIAGVVLGGFIGAALLFWQSQLPSPLVGESTASTSITERQSIRDKSHASLQAVNLAEQARGMIFPIFDRPRQALVDEVFRRVTELDTDYFGGYAGRAQTLATLAILSPPGPSKDDYLFKAKEMAKSATRLGPTSSWTQSANAWVAFADRDFARAKKLSDRSYELAPDDGRIIEFHGTLSLFSGYFSEAIKIARVGRLKTSNSSQRFANRNITAAASYHLGEYQKSLDSFHEAADIGDPVSAPSVAFQAAGLYRLGKVDEAKSKVDELTMAWPDANIENILKGIYQHSHHVDQILLPLLELGWEPPIAQDNASTQAND